MTNSSADTTLQHDSRGWRWAPAWVIAFVALWPLPGIAEAVMVLGALLALLKLVLQRFRSGTHLLTAQAWALTSVLFFAYWLPQLFASFDAVDRARALREVGADLRYLPFLWLVAMSVASPRNRRITLNGIAIISGTWVTDGLLQALFGTSPLFWSLDALKHVVSGHGMCPVEQAALVPDRLSGVLGPCNLKLGLVIASLSPFLLHAVQRRFGVAGWMIAALLTGIVILLAGSRASWISYALVLLWSGWRLMGWKRLLGVFAIGLATLIALYAISPQVRQRVVLTTQAMTQDGEGVDVALSGRTRIWQAAACMVREHPINGVGPRGFREAFPACDPAAGQRAAWGNGPALHAHQIVLEILSETGIIGLFFWFSGAAMAWRAWRYASPQARDRARPAMLALAATVFPLNTHLAFYSTFWGGLTLMLAALYAGALLAHDDDAPIDSHRDDA